MEEIQIKAVIEALVFVSESLVTLEAIREVLDEIPKKELQRIVEEMIAEYQNAPRGFSLTEVGGGYQFRTRPEFVEWVKKLKKIKPFALSQPSLETLAIVREPCLAGGKLLHHPLHRRGRYGDDRRIYRARDI